MDPSILSIQVGLPRDLGDADAQDPMDQPWRSGFYKAPVAGPVHAGRANIDGDGQADLRVHGGPDKAILCYSAGHYPFWRSTLHLDDFPYGAFGENLTIAGLDEAAVCIGDLWQVADVHLQVSQPRQPCWKLAQRWRLKELPFQVIDNGKSGWYVRVLREGTFQAGQEMKLVDRPHPDWSIARANRLMFHEPDNFVGMRELADMQLLADSWRHHFATRIGRSGKQFV